MWSKNDNVSENKNHVISKKKQENKCEYMTCSGEQNRNLS